MSNAKHSPVTYIMLRVEDSRDSAIDTVMQALDENNIHHVEFFESKEITIEREDDIGGPVIYFP